MSDRFTVSLAVRCALGLAALILVLCLVPNIQILVQQHEKNPPLLFTWILTGLCSLGTIVSVLTIFIVPSPNDQLYQQAVSKEQNAERRLDEAQRHRTEGDQLKREAEVTREANQLLQSSLISQKDKLQREVREFQAQHKLKVAELERRENALKDLQDKLNELQQRLDDQSRSVQSDQAIASQAREQAQKEADNILSSVEHVKRENERLLQEAHTRIETARAEELSLTTLREQLQTIQTAQTRKQQELDAQATTIGQQAEQAAVDRSAAESQRQQAQELAQQAQQLHHATTQIQNRIDSLRSRCWPAWVAESQLEPNMESLEQLTVAGNCNAAMLLAYLQLFQAIESHPDVSREFNYLWPTVRETGRFLAALCNASDAGHSAGSEQLLAWGKALNRASKGRFTISVPTIGANFNPAQMESKSGPIATVSRINNWAVSNAKSIVASKAEVT